MAKVRSTSSPVGWPKPSLMRLNQSRSFSELFDPPVGILEFEAAVVEQLAHRAAIESHERALSDRQDVTKRRGKTFKMAGDGHADRRAGEQENRRQTRHCQRPGN